jgi:SAM-dependent methyltransferase
LIPLGLVGIVRPKTDPTAREEPVSTATVPVLDNTDRSVVSLCRCLERLYCQQALRAPDAYLGDHGNARQVLNHVHTFRWYAPYLPAGGALLDWGCRHAPDSCLLRAVYCDSFALHGSDFVEPEQYGAFRDHSGMTYTKLNHPWVLPFDTHAFDVIIGSGTLEHTALDYESLKELYRVLKNDGMLVISYLPNAWSYREFVNRVLRKRKFHRRLYHKREIVRLLKRAGFYPLDLRYQTFFWEQQMARLGEPRWARSLLPFLRWLTPAFLSSTICCVARKVDMM